MAADHATALAIDHQLVERAGVASGERRLHRPEARLVDIDDTQFLDRFGLCETDDAYLRFGEHRRRHIAVIHGRRTIAEHRIGKGMTLADRDRREIDPVGDVAHRIDAVSRRARIFIDGDAAVAGDLDIRRLQTEALDVRPPPGGEHHLVGSEYAAVG